MELALLIPLALLCGFIFSTRCNILYYKLHRYSAQFLYLKASTYGFYLVLWASFLTFMAFQFLPNSTINYLSEKISIHLIFQSSEILTFNSNDADIEKNLAIDGVQFKALALTSIALTSLFLTYLTAFFSNFRLDFPKPFIQLCTIIYLTTKVFLSGVITVKAKKIFEELEDNKSDRKVNAELFAVGEAIKDRPLDYFLYKVSRSLQIISITLDTNKVYVGTILSPGEVSESEGLGPEIKVYPVASGYRNPDDQQLILTTNYKFSTDNVVFIKMDRITTVSNFDPSTYHKVKPIIKNNKASIKTLSPTPNT